MTPVMSSRMIEAMAKSSCSITAVIAGVSSRMRALISGSMAAVMSSRMAAVMPGSQTAAMASVW